MPKVCITVGPVNGTAPKVETVTAAASTEGTRNRDNGCVEAVGGGQVDSDGNAGGARPGLGRALRDMDDVMGMGPYPLMEVIKTCHEVVAIYGGYRIHEIVKRILPTVPGEVLRTAVCASLYSRDPIKGDQEILAEAGMQPEGAKTFGDVAGHWKVSIGYFLIAGISATIQAELIKTAFVKLSEAGIRGLALVMDGHATNQAMVSKLDGSLKFAEIKNDF